MIHIHAFDHFSSKRILTFKQTIQYVHKSKLQKKRVGFCQGGYDLLHPGHIKHLESAKKLCDVLIVGVTTNKFVTERKGTGRPILHEALRAYALASLSVVDIVTIIPFKTAIEAITLLKPTVYIKGPDYKDKKTPGISAERAVIAAVGGKILYTKDPKLSTTEIIEYIKKL